MVKVKKKKIGEVGRLVGGLSRKGKKTKKKLPVGRPSLPEEDLCVGCSVVLCVCGCGEFFFFLLPSGRTQTSPRQGFNFFGSLF